MTLAFLNGYFLKDYFNPNPTSEPTSQPTSEATRPYLVTEFPTGTAVTGTDEFLVQLRMLGTKPTQVSRVFFQFPSSKYHTRFTIFTIESLEKRAIKFFALVTL